MQKLAQVNIEEHFGGFQGTTSDLVTLFISGSLTIAGITLLFLVVFGGMKIIAGAGNNDPQATAKGKQAFSYAFLGFVVIVLAYLLILIIEKITGESFVTNPFSYTPFPGP